MEITAINLFIEVDGEKYIAPIRAEAVDLFIGMLPAFQGEGAKSASLVALPDEVSRHLIAARRELLARFEARRTEKKGKEG